jgi:hypothetical protein
MCRPPTGGVTSPQDSSCGGWTQCCC